MNKLEQPCAETGAAVSAWRDIESAPEDGSFVLGCQLPDEPAKGWHKAWEQWKAPLSIAYRGFHPNAPGKAQWRDAKGSPVSCTHWMPLPPPPSSHDGLREGSARADSAEPASLERSTVVPEAEQAGKGEP